MLLCFLVVNGFPQEKPLTRRVAIATLGQINVLEWATPAAEREVTPLAAPLDWWARHSVGNMVRMSTVPGLSVTFGISRCRWLGASRPNMSDVRPAYTFSLLTMRHK